MMSLLEMIAQLQQEKEILEEAIEALNRLTERRMAKRGRPPQWVKDAISKQRAEKPKKDPD